MKPVGRPRPSLPPKKDTPLEAVRAALGRGCVLRFEGPHFMEQLHRPGEGPTYKAEAVMRAVRLKLGRVVSRETGGLREIEVHPENAPRAHPAEQD